MRGWKIIRREFKSKGEATYLVVDRELYDNQVDINVLTTYYKDHYIHDDTDGTELIFLSPGGAVYARRVYKPEPKLDLIAI